MLALSCQGVYGARTALAQEYKISRTFLYQMLLATTLCLNELFSDDKDIKLPPNRLNLNSAIVLLRLASNVSISGISEILRMQGYPNDSAGMISTVGWVGVYGNPAFLGSLLGFALLYPAYNNQLNYWNNEKLDEFCYNFKK